MEEIYRLEEMKQENSVKDNQSRSSKVSNSSRVSNRSSVAKRAELAGLKAEMEAKIKTQEMEIQTEQIKADADVLSAKLMKETQRRMELLELEKKIAKETAIEDVLKEDRD